ncbi:MAG: glutamine-hydrolyzing GMP synthase, partial [Clostridiales bacterium]|nr:glutamine-hydrolyzing GMP synthase [Clostridiales bacterium]
MEREIIIVLDFGGQYNQLIARRIRECNVYCEVLPYNTSLNRIKELEPKGIIFTGGPASVYEMDAPACDKEIFDLGIPILGICYGCQIMTESLGGKVSKAPLREYGKTVVSVNNSSNLFKGIAHNTTVWMSHTDYIEKSADGFNVIASSESCPVAAIENSEKNLYGVQFHPEVAHTVEGTKMIKNFLYEICNCSGDWKMASFTEYMIKSLRDKIGDKKVLCALSGGVDSSVAAVMISKAVGKQLTCIFVDHGLLRKNEGDEVEKIFSNQFDLNFIRVNAQQRFYDKLAGITEPEQKRKIIGEEFIRVFEEEAKKIGTVDYLVQG